MTEINIEHKQRRSIWPWLLGLAALVLALVLFTRDDEPDEAAVRSDSAALYSPGTVGSDTLAPGVRADTGTRR
jgi:hypothetical protein